MDIKRGREKTVASPDGEARKKKGSLFRRASLSRKKNKEEAKMRSKSKDRYAEHSQSTNTLSMSSNAYPFTNESFGFMTDFQMTSVILLKRKKPNLHPYHVTSNHHSVVLAQKPKTKILLEGELWILKILFI